MAHELDITDGIAHFATARTPAWHRLGTVFEDEMTVAEALEAAHLANWNVTKLEMQGIRPVLTDTGVDQQIIAAPAHRLVVRTNPITGRIEPLGPVGKDWQPVQNEELGEFLEALLDMSGARFLTTAGSLRGGTQVFYCAKLPDQMLVGGVDRHDLYVTAMNGHDQSMAIQVIASPIRVVCANTQYAAIRRAEQTWKAKHTKNALRAMEAARKGLDMAFKFNAAFEAEAERMINESLSLVEFDKIVAGLFDDEVDRSREHPRAAQNRVARTETLHRLWVSPTQKAIEGTRWAGYNVLTEYYDHFAAAKGGDDGAKTSGRALSAVTGLSVGRKRAAFEAMRVPA